QVMMMQIVVYGIAAGNQVWSVAVGAMSAGTGTMGSAQITGDRKGPVRQLLSSMVCSETINNNAACKTSFSNVPSNYYTKVSGNTAYLYVGIQDDPDFATLCGGMQSSANDSQYAELDNWLDINKGAMRSAA
ncbi:MAG TPA: hypothetical protein PLD88_08755, partial [Candidatus Berkiella sp.]|nr:hypothetical protein [Candidatus Berkiella sp.]